MKETGCQVNIEKQNKQTYFSDRYRFDTDPDRDPKVYFDGDPADPDWHQNDADLHADPTPTFTHVGKSKKINFFGTAMPFTMFFLSHQWHKCHLDYHIEIFWKKIKKYISLELILIRIVGSGSAFPGCRSRSGKIMRIRSDPDPDPQH